jgi:Flp pilus assembly protein TadG
LICEPQSRIRELLRKAEDERGDALLESALMLIFLLSVLFGIVGFGHALYTYNFVSNAARDATRWSSVRGFTCAGLAGGCPATAANVQTYVSGVPGMGLDTTKITATTTWVAPPNSLAICAAHSNYPGCVVQVQVQYQYKFIFPLLPKSTYTMQSTSQMVISQ